jgi:transposase
MPKPTIEAHLDKHELKQKMNEAQGLDQFKRWQVIYLRLTQPQLSVNAVADASGVSYRTVTQWTWMYNKFGPRAYCLAGRGGRRKGLVDLEQERRLLEELTGKAQKGHIVTVRVVRKRVERLLGHSVSKDYAYDLLHRHEWRKVVPRPHHPKRNKAKQQAFKKTSRTCWIPPEKPFTPPPPSP